MTCGPLNTTTPPTLVSRGAPSTFVFIVLPSASFCFLLLPSASFCFLLLPSASLLAARSSVDVMPLDNSFSKKKNDGFSSMTDTNSLNPEVFLKKKTQRVTQSIDPTVDDHRCFMLATFSPFWSIYLDALHREVLS